MRCNRTRTSSTSTGHIVALNAIYHVHLHVGYVSIAHQQTPEKPQDFKGRLADTAVQTQKLVEQQKLRPTIHCENEELENARGRMFSNSNTLGQSSQWTLHRDTI